MTGTTGGLSRDAELAYEAFAPFYDDFTASYDYDVWLGNLLPHLEHCGLTGSRLLDVACGTGKSFVPMLERGWEVTACDISGSMVTLARGKVGPDVRIEVADMRALPVFGEFDLVWALSDSVNYLLTVEELTQALAGMRDNLASDGLLAFDLNTLHTYRTFFAGTEERTLADGSSITWKGLTSPEAEPGSICEATYAVGGARANPGTPPAHRQRHFRPEEVRGALAEAGLDLRALFGHGFDAVLEQPVDEDRHSKMVFIAAKAKGGRDD